MAKKEKKYGEVTRKYGDPWIWGIYFMLIIVSLIESYSASSREVATAGVLMPIIKQAVFLGLGAVCVLVLYRVDYNRKLVLFIMVTGLAIFTLASLIYVMLFGQVINGAQRAIVFPGGITLQPAELAKLSIVTVLAYLFSRNQMFKDVKTKGVVFAAVAVLLYGGLMIQSGLTNTLLLMCISFTMMICGGVSFKKIIIVMACYVLVFGLFMVIKSHNEKQEANLNQAEIEVRAEGDTIADIDPAMDQGTDRQMFARKDTWKSRIAAWWNSDSLVYKPITSKNQQEMFSRMAQAHGGITGVGIGQSRECSRLPLAFSDYIYSIIIEETGLIGGIFVMLLYLALLARAAMIMKWCGRSMPALLVMGMASMIALQAMFHMAINTGLFPVSGQPLPLISKGGTSILVTSVAFGVMLSVSRTIASENHNKKMKNNPDAQADAQAAERPTYLIKENEWK